jgi:xylulokinase
MTRWSLGLDVSTQSVTAVAIDAGTSHGTAASMVVESVTLDSVSNGACKGGVAVAEGQTALADPLVWLCGLEAVLHRLASRIDMATISSICVSAQQHGTVYLSAGYREALEAGADGAALDVLFAGHLSRRLSPIWMDTSATDEANEIARALGGREAVSNRTGSAPAARFAGPQIRRFAKADPSAWRQTARVHLVSSFITSVLAGCDAPVDLGDGAGMNLVDLAAWEWWAQAVAATAPDLAGKLPALAGADCVVGTVSRYMRERFGMAASCKVVVGTGDNPASLVGIGGATPGTLVVSLGTSDTVFMASRELRTDPAFLSHTFGGSAAGFMMLTCVRNGSLAREAVSRRSRCADWSDFSARIDETPPAVSVCLPFEVEELTPPAPASSVSVGPGGMKGGARSLTAVRAQPLRPRPCRARPSRGKR